MPITGILYEFKVQNYMSIYLERNLFPKLNYKYL